eukprot:TRINITY_DN7908_c0_g1_i1.p1 TRINITY_DN7908_c0_g1~~TRINITY_DN7908_c0_g1_i1.p1  ORF type:complete len:246 (+),score=18.97 TRINITY_DN7908_c0_g1_i1:19-756(+)
MNTYEYLQHHAEGWPLIPILAIHAALLHYTGSGRLITRSVSWILGPIVESFVSLLLPKWHSLRCLQTEAVQNWNALRTEEHLEMELLIIQLAETTSFQSIIQSESVSRKELIIGAHAVSSPYVPEPLPKFAKSDAFVKGLSTLAASLSLPVDFSRSGSSKVSISAVVVLCAVYFFPGYVMSLLITTVMYNRLLREFFWVFTSLLPFSIRVLIVVTLSSSFVLTNCYLLFDYIYPPVAPLLLGFDN